jgi:hypothetical protein
MLHEQPAIITGRASKRLAVGQPLVGRPSRFGFGSEASGEVAVIEVGIQNRNTPKHGSWLDLAESELGARPAVWLRPAGRLRRQLSIPAGFDLVSRRRQGIGDSNWRHR